MQEMQGYNVWKSISIIHQMNRIKGKIIQSSWCKKPPPHLNYSTSIHNKNFQQTRNVRKSLNLVKATYEKKTKNHKLKTKTWADIIEYILKIWNKAWIPTLTTSILQCSRCPADFKLSGKPYKWHAVW